MYRLHIVAIFGCLCFLKKLKRSGVNGRRALGSGIGHPSTVSPARECSRPESARASTSGALAVEVDALGFFEGAGHFPPPLLFFPPFLLTPLGMTTTVQSIHLVVVLVSPVKCLVAGTSSVVLWMVAEDIERNEFTRMFKIKNSSIMVGY